MDLLKPITEKKYAEVEDLQHLKSNYYLLEAFIEIPKDGSYTFSLNTKEQCLVKLHRALLFDADFDKPNSTLKRRVNLQKGLHKVKIYFRNTDDKVAPFDLSWTIEMRSECNVNNEFWIE